MRTTLSDCLIVRFSLLARQSVAFAYLFVIGTDRITSRDAFYACEHDKGQSKQ